ncbi:MAG: DNA gyrase inhibitor YacG [Janthinobacterium lividum]
MRRCPICGRAATPETTPFCSKRCADVDLHRWFGEGYRVPVEIDDDDRDSPDEQ